MGALLAARGLPVALTGVAVEAVLEALGHDKKRLGAGVPFVLLRSPGQIFVTEELPIGDVEAAVRELAA